MSTSASRPVIAFQGVPGAYSNMACRDRYPDHRALACPTFEDAFAAVTEGRAALAMIPVENSLAGRVADIHHLLPESGLFIIGETFQRVHHQLLALPDADITDLRTVHSHVHALAQCRNLVRKLGLTAVVEADTAGAAAEIAARGNSAQAAIASAMAAENYGLKILAADIEDAAHNTTRFLIMARDPVPADPNGAVITSFVFLVRNIPAALYKALGGFATNGVNMLKLESYILDGSFTAAQFYCDVAGHPDDPAIDRALDELRYFSRSVKILGSYPADPLRAQDTARDRSEA